MTIVQQTLYQGDGVTPLVGASVTVALVGAGFTTGGQIVASQTAVSDSNGNVQFNLLPQSQITPFGTYYSWTNPDGSVWAFKVSDAPGPLSLRSLLVAKPIATGVINVGLSAGEVLGATAAAAAAAASAALGGKADLVSGVVPRAQLPNISGVMDVAGVASQSAMLALTQPDPDTQLRVQRTDTPGVQWVLNPGLAVGTLSNWLQLPFDASGAAAQAQAAAQAFTTSQLGNYVTLPASGTAAGRVPTVQSDGTVAYAAPTASPIAYDTDGVPYLTS